MYKFYIALTRCFSRSRSTAASHKREICLIIGLNHPLQIVGWNEGGPAGHSCKAGRRRRGSRVAQIGLRVRFRTGRGVFWHRLAFVSDSASGLGPAFPSHRRSTCENAERLFSSWFFWLAESDTKANLCQKTPLPVRNRTRRPICAMADPPSGRAPAGRPLSQPTTCIGRFVGF